MDFDLSEEQRAIQDTARAFARDEMMPFAREWDEEEIFPADTLRRSAATLILQRHAGDFPGEPLANQPRDA